MKSGAAKVRRPQPGASPLIPDFGATSKHLQMFFCWGDWMSVKVFSSEAGPLILWYPFALSQIRHSEKQRVCGQQWTTG